MTETKRKRKDPKGRNLRTGETYDEKTGRYRYSYQDPTGKRRQLYSWTLTRTDPIPAGKKQGPGDSLREKEEAARSEAAKGIDSQAGSMTVYQLLERYVILKSPTVRESTRKGYQTQMKFMKENAFAQVMARKRIKKTRGLKVMSPTSPT